MKIPLIIFSVLLTFPPEPFTDGKTVASNIKIIQKITPLIREEGLNFKNAPKLLVDAVPVLRDLYDLWHVLLREPNLNVMDALFRSREHELLGRIIVISDQVSQLDKKVNYIAETTILTILNSLPKMIRLESNLHELRLIINQINFSHDQLRLYLKVGYQNVTNESNDTKYSEMISAPNSKLRENGLKFSKLVGEMANDVMKRDTDPNTLLEKFTLLDFAAWATGHGYNSLKSLTKRMNDMILSEDSDIGIFPLIREVSEVTHCDKIF